MTWQLSYRAAWREVARLWLGPMTYKTRNGLCWTVCVLSDEGQITDEVTDRMDARLEDLLEEYDGLHKVRYLAPHGTEREARAMLALLFAEGA